MNIPFATHNATDVRAGRDAPLVRLYADQHRLITVLTPNAARELADDLITCADALTRDKPERAAQLRRE